MNFAYGFLMSRTGPGHGFILSVMKFWLNIISSRYFFKKAQMIHNKMHLKTEKNASFPFELRLLV